MQSQDLTNGLAGARERIGDIAQQASQKATDLATNFTQDVRSRASDFSTNLEKNTDDALSAAGDKLTRAAEAIDRNAPEEGSLATAAQAASEHIKASGEYLSKHGVGDITKDVNDLVHKYPLQSLGIGLGIGLLVGKLLRR